MSSAKTTLVVLREAISSAGNTVQVSGIYPASDTDHSPWLSDLDAGKLVVFTSSGTATVTDSAFSAPKAGQVYRVGNNNSPSASPDDTITINDGAGDIVTLAPGEFVRLTWVSSASVWLKIAGV